MDYGKAIDILKHMLESKKNLLSLSRGKSVYMYRLKRIEALELAIKVMEEHQ